MAAFASHAEAIAFSSLCNQTAAVTETSPFAPRLEVAVCAPLIVLTEPLMGTLESCWYFGAALVSQIRMSPSREQDVNTHEFCGWKLTCFMLLECPANCERSCCVRTSNRRTDWSPEAVSIRESSLDHEMSNTAFSCAVIVTTVFAVERY